jgi:hypothetical protein
MSIAILTGGGDLAKNVIAVHGVNETGRAELMRSAVPREKPLAVVAIMISRVMPQAARRRSLFRQLRLPQAEHG